MLKSIDPNEIYEFSPAGAEDTVISFHAMSGSAMSGVTGDVLFDIMIDRCVTTILNINVKVIVEKASEDKEAVWERVDFCEFIPKEHPEVNVHDILPSTVCNALGSKIWAVSHLSKTESGE